VKARLEKYFQFRELRTNWRTEILAGCTTFVTMAYIIFVNPAILHETGMPLTAVVAATCPAVLPNVVTPPGPAVVPVDEFLSNA